MLLGRYQDGIPPGAEAVELARRIEARRELSRALNALGTSLAMVGKTEGFSMLRESIEVADAIGAGTEAARSYNNLVACLRTPLNDLAQAEEVFLAGLEYTSRKGVAVRLWTGSVWREPRSCSGSAAGGKQPRSSTRCAQER